MNKTRTALLTAGLGQENFRASAERLIRQASELYRFDLVLNLGTSQVLDLCPTTAQIYEKFLNSKFPGFGFWAWKPEIVYEVASGKFGPIEQIVWVDSGCEIFSNDITRTVFRNRVISASRGYGWFHTLDTNDIEYSKRVVIEKFPNLKKESLGKPQIQANYFHLNVLKSMELIEKWYTYSRHVNLMNLDVRKDEDVSFIEHRSDQSLLSLLTKDMSIYANAKNLPSGRTNFSKIRGMVHPIWIARNRTGNSILPLKLKSTL